MKENVEKYLKKRANDLAEWWEERISETLENKKLTPIESLFFIEWEKKEAEIYDEIPLRYYENEKIPLLCSQVEIEIKGKKGKILKKYRVDFLIIMKDLRRWDEPDKKENMVIIEIDSHLWHGTTPEQFEKEKKRERDLMSAGYKIIRFSGREVYRNPVKCIDEVEQFLGKMNREK